MNGDVAALCMGLAAAAVFIGYQIRKRSRRNREKEQLLREFGRKEEHTDE
ncbi:MAG: hypothetical protein IKE31_12710 [Eubacterium sp.]|nr:hypothetical protein [Eubacterium sp.]